MKLQRLRKSPRILGIGPKQRTVKFKEAFIEPREITPQEQLLLRGIYATDIEAMVYLWLEGRGEDFSFQSSVFGGRREAGGQVADFILYSARAYPLVIRVMGEYWHQSPEQQQKDEAAKSILEAYGFEVVDVWESKILTSLNYTMEQALKGIEIQ